MAPVSDTKIQPVIFLAFANDRDDSVGYLRNLPDEARRLRDALEAAEQAGLCEVVLRSNSTAGDIFKVFQDPKYRNRIAIFHYGGHANGYQLLLESAAGEAAVADAGGLAAFLAQQQGLQLAVLNGCSTQQQTDGLLAANIPVVISTSRAIDDQVATNFACQFYQGLAGGASIRTAYNEAEASVQTSIGENTRGVLAQKSNDADGQLEVDRWPWNLYLREGSENADQWNLPEAVDDPLFGLPSVPEQDLPETPYRHLNWFTRKDAEVFFGRGHQIRELYDRLTAPRTAPILLFYGQSGVGKSSVLDAGLIPRLEQDYEVRYLRRGADGLLATLQRAFRDAADLPVQEVTSEPQTEPRGKAIVELLEQMQRHSTGQDSDAVPAEQYRLLGTMKAIFSNTDLYLRDTANELLEKLKPTPSATLPTPADTPLEIAWRKKEQQLGKPLIVFLDQVEELYTHPNADVPDELERLLQALQAIFTDPKHRPQGKLVLGFRKEWLAELESHLIDYRLPRTKVFLEPLDRRGIMEVVRGPTRSARLRERYGLTVEDELAPIIADDLLEDRDSAIAPTLQILLTKMWSKATEENYEHPQFTQALYQDLKRDGILLRDFLDQQIAAFRQKYPDAVNSGLLLDIVAMHTTALGTAGHCTLEELQQQYAHLGTDLQDLLQQCQDLHLLTIAAGSQKEKRKTTRLAHDTLAPLVRERYDESDLPGQRARRILDNRSVDWAEPEVPGTPLDAADLALVEQGIAGTRSLSPIEQRLLKASREQRARALHFARALKLTGALATVIITVLGALGWWQYRDATRQEAVAVASNARSLLSTTPVDGLVYALKAVSLSRSLFPPLRELPRELSDSLFAAIQVARSGGMEIRALHGHTGWVNAVTVSGDGEVIVSAADDRTVRVWDMQGVVVDTYQYEDKVNSVAVSDDAQIIVAGLADGTVVVREVSGGDPLIFVAHDDVEVTAVAFSRDNQLIASGSDEGGVRLWDRQGQRLDRFDDSADQNHEDKIMSLAFNPSGTLLASASDDDTGRVWDFQTQQSITLEGHDDDVSSVAFHPDGETLVSSSSDRTLRLWSRDGSVIGEPLRGHENIVMSAVFSPDGMTIVSGSEDRTVRLWDLNGAPLALPLRGHLGPVFSVAYHPDGKTIVSGSLDQTVRLWQPQLPLRGHQNYISSVAVSGDGNSIVSADINGNVHRWDAQGNPLDNFLAYDFTDEDDERYVTVALNHDGTTIVTGSNDGAVNSWDHRGNARGFFANGAGNAADVYSNALAAVAIARDGTIVSGGGNRTVRVWDTQGRIVDAYEHDDAVNAVAVSRDAQIIVAGLANGTVVVHDRSGGETTVINAHGDEEVTAVALSIDSQIIISGGDDRTVRRWNLDGNPIGKPFTGHLDVVRGVAFVGDMIVSGGEDYTVRLSDTQGNAIGAPLAGHNDWVTAVAVLPEQGPIVSASDDFMLRLWNVDGDSASWIDEACARLQSHLIFASEPQVLYTPAFAATLDEVRSMCAAQDNPR